jgi:hypothetical protein
MGGATPPRLHGRRDAAIAWAARRRDCMGGATPRLNGRRDAAIEWAARRRD